MARLRKATITRPDEFQRCYREGRVFKNHLAVIHVYARGDREGARVGFSVSRKVGNAVERNRVKRWLREAVRPSLKTFPAGVDIILSGRVRAKDAGFWALKDAVDALLRKAGLWTEKSGEDGREAT